MSFWSAITGTTPQDEQDAELAKGKAAFEAALKKRQDEGTITADQAAHEQQLTDNTYNENTDAAAWDGFKQGATDGLNNVLNFPGEVVGAAGQGSSQLLWGVLKNIPWWVYLVAAGALFVWMGGLALLRGRLSR